MKNNNPPEFGGVPKKELKWHSQQVHNHLRGKSFTPVGYERLGNMPNRAVTPDESNVEVFHDGTVQLCLHYSKQPDAVADCWWLAEMPEIVCDVFVVFKVHKRSGYSEHKRTEVVLSLAGEEGFRAKSKHGIDHAYHPASLKFNRMLERVMQRVWA